MSIDNSCRLHTLLASLVKRSSHWRQRTLRHSPQRDRHLKHGKKLLQTAMVLSGKTFIKFITHYTNVGMDPSMTLLALTDPHSHCLHVLVLARYKSWKSSCIVIAEFKCVHISSGNRWKALNSYREVGGKKLVKISKWKICTTYRTLSGVWFHHMLPNTLLAQSSCSIHHGLFGGLRVFGMCNWIFNSYLDMVLGHTPIQSAHSLLHNSIRHGPGQDCCMFLWQSLFRHPHMTQNRVH